MDPKTILDVLKQASPFDIFLISFFGLPFIAEAWLAVFADLMEAQQPYLWGSLGLIIAVYFIGVGSMLLGSSRIKKREVARDQIINYLEDKGFTLMSLENVRKKITASYTDKFLNDLIARYPGELRTVRITGGKPGIGRIVPPENEIGD